MHEETDNILEVMLQQVTRNFTTCLSQCFMSD